MKEGTVLINHFISSTLVSDLPFENNHSLKSILDTWKWMQFEPPGQQPPPRTGHTLIHHGRNIVLFGGLLEGGVRAQDIWKFDLEARESNHPRNRSFTATMSPCSQSRTTPAVGTDHPSNKPTSTCLAYVRGRPRKALRVRGDCLFNSSGHAL